MLRAARFALLGAAAVTVAWAAFPRLISVEPALTKAGDELTASGQNLGDDTVAKLFLTAGGKDVQVKIEEQSAESIRFTLPAKVAAGTYRLMVQTAGATPTLMEQPVMCEVVAAEDLEARLQEAEAELKRMEEPAAEPEPETSPGP